MGLNNEYIIDITFYSQLRGRIKGPTRTFYSRNVSEEVRQGHVIRVRMQLMSKVMRRAQRNTVELQSSSRSLASTVQR